MSRNLKYLSRIKDEFDTVICGVNGVFMQGSKVDSAAVETLIQIYQSGKKIALASNSGMRARDMYFYLKQRDVPMNIFYALITAGEIAHFYLQKHHNLGRTYYSLNGKPSTLTDGLDYTSVESIVMADFVLAETESKGLDAETVFPILEQALRLRLPLLCVGNNTSVMGENGVLTSIGAAAEQYAMMGGNVLSFGKPDAKIAAYLAEPLPNFDFSRCLVIGDCMATDMRMGNACGAKVLLITEGVHQISTNAVQQIEDLSKSYGLNIDYYMEKLQW